MAEPGRGERIDACREVLRVAGPNSAAVGRLGRSPGTSLDGELGTALAGLIDSGSPGVLLCGFDPTPHRETIVRGLEAGLFEMAGSMHRVLGIPVPGYGLNPRYRCNPVSAFDDTANQDEWQQEVYDLALRLARENGWTRILDVGCGGGYKLVHGFPPPEFRTIGVDRPPTVEFLRRRYPDREWLALDLEREDMLRFRADLVIASDVIEHLDDPDLLLEFITGCDADAVLLSTPDAATLVDRGERGAEGPPGNPHHVREWTLSEFSRYVSGTLEVLRQELYAPNATQVLLCRAPIEVPRPEPRVHLRESASRVLLPHRAGGRSGVGFEDASAGGYVEHSRTRVLEAALRRCDAPLITLALTQTPPDEECVTRLESAARDGAELAIRTARPASSGDWSPLEGCDVVVCDRERLVAGLRHQRGPHGPQRALLELMGRSRKVHVEPTAGAEDPALFLARLDALVSLWGPDATWPDPRPVLGPAVRDAMARAEASGRRELMADLQGFWDVVTGVRGTAPSTPVEVAECPPSNPELEVPFDDGSTWTLADGRCLGLHIVAIDHARRQEAAPILNLVLPWAAGISSRAFAGDLVQTIERAGLDPRRISPLVVLERPLWACELAWMERRFKRC